MKRKISSVLFGVMFLCGFGILVYPTVANQWNTYRQNRLISRYENTLEEMEPEDFTREWERANAFNATIKQNNFYGEMTTASETEYEQVLNVADDGIMGYLSIPKINVKLAIYHGVEDEILQTGIGHLNGTGLPIGGEKTHTVLAAHRGLPSARLFTDVDQLEAGDKFYIHVLDEVLAYEVDQILPMVEKDDKETLETAMQAEDGKDQATLFTCTPYGVNSHRLLVRGTRVPYTGEDEAADSLSQSMVKAVQNYYMLYLIMGLSVTLLVIVIMKVVFGKNQQNRNGEGKKQNE